MRFHHAILKISFLSAALAVVLGAIGAHALKKHITPESLAIFETGVRFHFYHSIALAVTGIVYHGLHTGRCAMAARFFALGLLLFSGSLYCFSILGEALHFVVYLTPVGGICFIIGWLYLFLAVKKTNTPA